MTNGIDLFVRQLEAQQVRDFFYLVGGPMSESMERAIEAGIRGVDVRDERAATYAAVAYARTTGRPGVVMTCSGPGTVNATVGIAHAFADRAPVVLFGGSSATYLRTDGVFQETDQVGIMRPITKWSHQVPDAEAIPEIVARAFQVASDGSPGPVYVDLPSDVLYEKLAVEAPGPAHPRPRFRSAPDPVTIHQAVDRLSESRRPVVLAGSGVLWSDAAAELVHLAEALGAPCFTTPVTRGMIPDDHPLALPGARATALRETDCLLMVGTRDNYVVNYLRPPVIGAGATVIEVNVDGEDLARNRLPDVAILADARLALEALAAAVAARGPADYRPWLEALRDKDATARERVALEATSSDVPIHPLRLCAELARVLPRDAIRVVDGHETLGFARRGLPSYVPRSTLTPGVYGTMGVGVPFALGAQVGSPGSLVAVLTGDGAFGYHAMELDTAVRHSLPLVCVVANNGGWTAGRDRPGRFLGFTDYSRLADTFGCAGLRITDPGDLGEGLRSAVETAVRDRTPTIVNVEMAPLASSGRTFSRYTRHGTQHYSPV